MPERTHLPAGADLLESLQQPALVVDDEGLLLLANRAAVRTLRTPLAALRASHLADWFRWRSGSGATVDADPDAAFEALVAPMRGGAPTVTIGVAAPTARQVDLTATITAIGSLVGERPVWLIMLARREPVEAPLVSRERHRFFELSLDLLAFIGRDGYFVDVNPAWSMLGYTRERLFTHDYLEVVHPDDRERVADEVTDLLSGKPFTVDFTSRILDAEGGFRWYRWMAVADPAEDAVMAIGTDDTEQHRSRDRLHQMLRGAQERERELLQRLTSTEEASESKSTFLASLSHELRTPLNSVIGFADLLSENLDGGLSAQQLSYVERIHRNGMHLLSLVEEVLDLAKTDTGETERSELVDLDGLVHDAVVQSEGLVSAAHMVVTPMVPSGVGPVQGDRKRLLQVLLNLIGNAVKYGMTGMVLVEVVSDADGTAQRIDVVDQGPGVPEEQRSKVFEAFRRGSTTRADGTGTGLGLTISRTMCRAMGFGLVLDSVEGEGSTFSVLLGDDVGAPHHVPLSSRLTPAGSSVDG